MSFLMTSWSSGDPQFAAVDGWALLDGVSSIHSFLLSLFVCMTLCQHWEWSQKIPLTGWLVFKLYIAESWLYFQQEFSHCSV